MELNIPCSRADFIIVPEENSGPTALPAYDQKMHIYMLALERTQKEREQHAQQMDQMKHKNHVRSSPAAPNPQELKASACQQEEPGSPAGSGVVLGCCPQAGDSVPATPEPARPSCEYYSHDQGYLSGIHPWRGASVAPGAYSQLHADLVPHADWQQTSMLSLAAPMLPLHPSSVMATYTACMNAQYTLLSHMPYYG